MYWYASCDSILQNNERVVAYNLDPDVAELIAKDHNKIIRQLTQREITASARLTDMAIANLEKRCGEIYGVSVGNEIHLQRGDDGYWYATTTVDTLNQ